MKYFWLLLISLFWSLNANAEVVTQAIEYKHGDVVLEGYLAYDDEDQGERPGILVVHEWRGLDDHVKKQIERLAKKGYVAFAIDMYGKGILAQDHFEAAELSGLYKEDRELMRARAKAGLDVLKKHPLVDTDQMAGIGYCFGGTTVLELARSGSDDLKGVVSFHGALETPSPAQRGVVRSKVLVLHGAEDPHVPQSEVEIFKEEMRKAGADWQLVSFGGAMHSFTVKDADMPERGIAYNKMAADRSWNMMREFFDEVFAPEKGVEEV